MNEAQAKATTVGTFALKAADVEALSKFICYLGYSEWTLMDFAPLSR